MRHGGRPDPGEEWDGRTVPYEEWDGRTVPYEDRRGGYERARPPAGYDAYDVYETRSYDPTGYGAPPQEAYESRAPYEPHPPHVTPYVSPHVPPHPSPHAHGVPVYDAGGPEGGGAGYGTADDTLVHGVMAADPAEFAGARFAEPGMDAAEEETYGPSWEFEEGLARLLRTSVAEPAPPRIPRQRFAHRRQPKRLARLLRRIKRAAKPTGPVSWLKVISLTLAAVTAVVVAVVGALSGVISYDPLRRLAVPGAMGALAGFWPLLVYGPWIVASMSILRAAVHRRRAAHSWFVVVVFSAIAVYLCVAHAGHSPIRLAVAGLPPITALVCFHQLVRQITLTNPPRNGPRRPRHTARRD